MAAGQTSCTYSHVNLGFLFFLLRVLSGTQGAAVVMGLDVVSHPS